ncbi:MAG: LysM peptidoglycan-binding domain-containing protein, partial [Mesorhizobium sp.]
DNSAQPATAAPAGGEQAGVPETAAPKLEHADGAVIIRRGDSLWRISRRVYGHGIRYSTIYLANQKQIADPDKIWPGQVFTVPEKSSEGEAADLKALGDQATTVPAQ